MSLHFLVRSVFALVFAGIFGLLAKAAKQISDGNAEHYGQLAKMITDRNPIRFGLAGGLLVLAALAIYLNFVAAR